MTLEQDKRWSRNLFDTMTLGGMWSVPRSGLIFKKTDDHTLTLVTAMPFLSEMAEAAKEGRDVPPTEAKLKEFQRSDYDTIRNRFALAGITITGRENIGK